MRPQRHSSASALLLDLRTRVHVEVVAGLPAAFELEGLDDLDEVIDQMFVALSKSGLPLSVRDVCPHFGVVWPSGRALAAHLAEILPASPEKPRILELGCGLALPSLVAAKLGCDVLATDRHLLAQEFLRRNALRNRVRVEYAELDWRTAAQATCELEPFDLIIASDVLYDAFQPAALAAALEPLLRSGATALVADPGRRYLDQFVALIEAHGVEATLATSTASNGRVSQGILLVELRRP